MSKKVVKGIHLEIGGDTTGLTKALSDVHKKARDIQGEMREVDKSLKLDPTNTEILRQKQKLLADSVENTRDKLEALEKAKADADKRMANGDTSISTEQYRKLQREISDTTATLKKLEKQSDEAGETLEKVSKAKEGIGDLKKGFSIAAKGAAGFVAGVVAAGAALFELEENTREYREDLNKLKVGFASAEKDVKSAEKAYADFYGILGESDRAIEAVNHLAELTKNEEELSKWTTIAAGVNAKFTDSLPIEGLTEASNETAKMGKVTGVLADALNWVAGLEDKVNANLSKMTSEQERASYITQVLHDLYSETGETYLETNASIIANRDAQLEWNDAMAKVGELVAPLKAEVVSIGASMLSGAADYAQSVISYEDSTMALVDKINKENVAWKEAKVAQEEKTAAAVAEIDYTARLYDELQTLADENGKVTEQNKIRVKYILGELSEALGVEMKLTGDQIQGYTTLGASIDVLIAKRRAEIILASQEESYKKAINEIDQKKAEQDELRIAIMEKEIEVKKANASLTDYSTDQERLSVLSMQESLKAMRKTYSENDEVIQQYYTDISAYQTNYEALLSGNAEKIQQINNGVGESFAIAGEASEEALARQVVKMGLAYSDIQEKVDAGVKGVTQEMADEALAQYNLAVTEYQKIGKAIPDGMQVGIEDGKPSLKSKVANFVEQLKSWLTNKDALDTHSPSKWSEKIAEFVDDGLAIGLIKNADKVQKSMRELFGMMQEEREAFTEDITFEEKKYNEELERIRAEGSEKANKSYLEGLKKLADEAKEKRDFIREQYEAAVEDIKDAIDDLEKEMESYKNGLSKTNLLGEDKLIFDFDGKEMEYSIPVLADLSPKVAELETFIKNINSLKEMGIDETMIEQIQELGGEEGGKLAHALLYATPEMREKFIDDFKKIGELSGEATAEVFQKELISVADDLKAKMDELAPDLLQTGEDWGHYLGRGIVSKLREALSSLGVMTDYAVPAGGGTVVNYNTNIENNIQATPNTANEVAEAQRRQMEDLSNWGQIS